jgi:hypothetical protein
MRRELEQKLVKRFPTWFNVNGNAPPQPHAVRVPVRRWVVQYSVAAVRGRGAAVAELERETGERFEAVQVQQNLGMLRFYAGRYSDTIDERLAEAQKESSHTCEFCGQPGKQCETGGQVRAVCDTHVHSPEEQ